MTEAELEQLRKDLAEHIGCMECDWAERCIQLLAAYDELDTKFTRLWNEGA